MISVRVRGCVHTACTVDFCRTFKHASIFFFSIPPIVDRERLTIPIRIEYGVSNLQKITDKREVDK